jgi:putative nucleotidyltransferase with HDIG domain
MSDPIRFLNAFAHSLAVMTLYPEGHPSREKAVDAAYEELDGLAVPGGHPPTFTFLDDEVVFGRERLRELKSWDWGKRLVAAGIQRLEFERKVTRDEFDGFLQEVLARLMLSSVDTSEARQMRSLGIRFGAVGLQGQDSIDPVLDAAFASLPTTTLRLSLGEEAETFRWLQTEVQAGGSVPLLEAEAVVRSLSVAMHGDSRMVLPLLKLKEFDQYTTTHSLNVAVLAMGLAESLGCRPKDIRAIGVAGLLHDIGKIRIPLEVLTKPGKLNDEERAIMNSHPIDGARVIMQSDEDLGMAATVAYEHHIMLNGGGYPPLHYKRECALASRLVHVCDVYDALSTKRPYRDAWPAEKTMAYLEERAGSEFDPDLVTAFIRTLRQGQAQVRVLSDEAATESTSM